MVEGGGDGRAAYDDGAIGAGAIAIHVDVNAIVGIVARVEKGHAADVELVRTPEQTLFAGGNWLCRAECDVQYCLPLHGSIPSGVNATAKDLPCECNTFSVGDCGHIGSIHTVGRVCRRRWIRIGGTSPRPCEFVVGIEAGDPPGVDFERVRRRGVPGGPHREADVGGIDSLVPFAITEIPLDARSPS